MRITVNPTLDMESLEWLPAESYNYDGPIDQWCGATSEQKDLESQQANLSSDLANDYNTRFAGQTQTLGQLNTLLTNVQNGKLLPGFSAPTMTALQSGAINSATANAKNVETAVNVANAGRGGDSGLQPGTVGQEQATALTGVANQEAAQQQQIQLANQQASQQNTAMALGGYNSLASQENPEAFGSLAGNTGQSAYGMATQNAEIGAQEFGDIAGGVAALGTAAAGAYKNIEQGNLASTQNDNAQQ